MDQTVSIPTLVGRSADRDVLLGFAPANILHALSFADVLDEANGTGYQRRFTSQHSLDFRRYIKRAGATTPPLTFNLRPRDDVAWRVVHEPDGSCRLVLSVTHGRILSQVDCQHRLGHIQDLDLMLPFMVFLGLTEREEMEVFSTINSKAKGLSSSLLDYHAAHLVHDLGRDKPELFIALHLNEAADSPWQKQLDLGGNSTTGLKRKASLRTIQKSVRRFLSATSILESVSVEDAARMVCEYWIAVSTVLSEEWRDTRRHFLTKGVGVYALMGFLGDLWNESPRKASDMTRIRFADLLDDFARSFDWSNDGPLKGLGGESGAQEALILLRRARASHHHYVPING